MAELDRPPEREAGGGVMRFIDLRRKLALAICPELDPGRIDLALSAAAGGQFPGSVERARQIMALDRAYTSFRGAPLEWRDLKPAVGIPARAGVLSEGEAYDGITNIRRLRAPAPTAGGKGHVWAVALFSAIWPESLPWPSDVPRPSLDELEGSPEFWEFLTESYLHSGHFSFSSCYRDAVRVAEAEGWCVVPESRARRRIADVERPSQKRDAA